MFSKTLIVAALSTLPLAFAQNYYPAGNATSTYAAAPSGTGTSKPATHTVAVGQNGLTFTPDTINAKVGEDIVFEFFPKNHSVVQSSFENPCNPSDGGIFSGFIGTQNGRANKTFTIKVQDEKPIWLYCSQNQPSPHCAAGMVAVINPPTSGPNSLDAFKELAATKTESVSPAGGPSGGQISTPGSPSSASPSGTSTDAPRPTGAASSVSVGGALGVVAVAFGLLL